MTAGKRDSGLWRTRSLTAPSSACDVELEEEDGRVDVELRRDLRVHLAVDRRRRSSPASSAAVRPRSRPYSSPGPKLTRGADALEGLFEQALGVVEVDGSLGGLAPASGAHAGDGADDQLALLRQVVRRA